MQQTRRPRRISVHVPSHVREQLQSRWLTIPNLLTFSRIVATPFIVWGLVMNYWKAVFGLFLYAGLTDALDGFLARKLNAESIVGAYLDPIADKILFVSSFVTLFIVQFPSVPLPWWFVTLVLLREAVILIGSVVVVWCRPKAVIKPSKGGKLTVTGYTILIAWLFICHFASWMPRKSFTVGLVLVAALACISLMQYLWRGVRWMFSS
jgi:cardiolipin synthase